MNVQITCVPEAVSAAGKWLPQILGQSQILHHRALSREVAEAPESYVNQLKNELSYGDVAIKCHSRLKKYILDARLKPLGLASHEAHPKTSSLPHSASRERDAGTGPGKVTK